MARTLTVYLAADAAKFKAGLHDAETSATGLKGHIQNLSTSIRQNLGPAMLGGAAVVGAMAIKIGTDSVNAAIADQTEVTKLTTIMNNLGKAHDVQPVLNMIDALQRESGISESELRPSFQRLITSTNDTTKATDLLKQAMDISVATGKPLATVTDALAKAYDGNFTSLKRLGTGLDNATIKSGDMDKITSALSDRFGGSAAANAETYQGKINRLKIGFDELEESFGQGFLDSMTGAESGLGNLTQFMQDNEPFVNDLGKTVGGLVTQISDVGKKAVEAKTAFDGLGKQLGPVGEKVTTFIETASPLLDFLNSATTAANLAADAIERVLGLQQSAHASGPGNVDLLTGRDSTYYGSTTSVDPITASRRLAIQGGSATARTGG